MELLGGGLESCREMPQRSIILTAVNVDPFGRA